jgi:hypothetical protein
MKDSFKKFDMDMVGSQETWEFFLDCPVFPRISKPEEYLGEICSKFGM